MRKILEFLKPTKIHLLRVLLSNPVLNIAMEFNCTEARRAKAVLVEYRGEIFLSEIIGL